MGRAIPPVMHKDGFEHVACWVFDLDNTLYGPEARLFDQIEVLMTEYVMAALGVARAEADRLRLHYWRNHGTTLAGLMREHDLDPVPYLAHVHEIDLSGLEADPALKAAIGGLPGRKIVHTNGSRRHAERVVAARGLEGVFDGLYGIEDAGFAPKPERRAFETVFAASGVRPGLAAMFEDDPRNLLVPYDMGMRTVLVGGGGRQRHIHHRTMDLAGFLAGLV